MSYEWENPTHIFYLKQTEVIYMPTMRKDNESGAILFDRTPEEEQLNDLQQTTDYLMKKVEELEKKLQEGGVV